MQKLTDNLRKRILSIVFLALLVTFPAGMPGVHAEEAYDLIVPGADSRYYTADDISDMPLQVVNYAKNEIYALHGCLFDSAELAGYFSQQPWYSGSLREADFTDKVFNEYERENILLLNDREMALSDGNGYVLDQPGYNYDAVSQYLAARNGNIRAEALLMRLRKIIGTVSLKDRDGETYDVEENMRLFSGSILSTKAESSAIMDLDEVKLAILDERSRAALEKNDDGSRLVIQLKKGQLYFSVDEPLGTDETFDITFSDLRLAVRGTNGIVTIEDKQASSVILASGQAVIYAADPGAGEVQVAEIQAGEKVHIASDGTGRRTVERETLSEDSLPPFLVNCLKQDPDAVPKVLADTGWTGDTFSESAEELLAAYAGTYTAYPFLSGTYGLPQSAAMTLHGDGTVSGYVYPAKYGNNDIHPASVKRREDGVIALVINGSELFRIYPAGVRPEGYESSYFDGLLNLDVVNVRYLDLSGGAYDILYYGSTEGNAGAADTAGNGGGKNINGGDGDKDANKDNDRDVNDKDRDKDDNDKDVNDENDNDEDVNDEDDNDEDVNDENDNDKDVDDEDNDEDVNDEDNDEEVNDEDNGEEVNDEDNDEDVNDEDSDEDVNDIGNEDGDEDSSDD